tara:strand:+ start:103 stop:564 length:462 start_codon:yes stop_codon:yes gene_type:complete
MIKEISKNILVLQGPNLNLIGVRSKQLNERVTLDKINRCIKKKSNVLNVALKTLQTHHSGKAVTFLQRNRNWADGLLFYPGPWALSGYDILDTLILIQVPTIQVFFSEGFEIKDYSKNSVFSEIAVSTATDAPYEASESALIKMNDFLSDGNS